MNITRSNIERIQAILIICLIALIGTVIIIGSTFMIKDFYSRHMNEEKAIRAVQLYDMSFGNGLTNEFIFDNIMTDQDWECVKVNQNHYSVYIQGYVDEWAKPVFIEFGVTVYYDIAIPELVKIYVGNRVYTDRESAAFHFNKIVTLALDKVSE